MEYKIVTGGNPADLTHEVNKLIKDGWAPMGSHQVVIRGSQNTFSGSQPIRTNNSVEYTQTMTKDTVDNPK